MKITVGSQVQVYREEFGYSLRNKFMLLLDYTFYRLYLFFKDQRDENPEVKAALVVSLLQYFLLMDIVILVRLVYDFPFPDSKWYFLPLLILMAILNLSRYRDTERLKTFTSMWGNERENRKLLNGWLIALALVGSLLILAGIGFLKHNLKVL